MLNNVSSLGLALIILAISVFVSWLAGLVLKQSSKRFFSKTRTSLDDVIVSSLQGPLRTLLLIIGTDLAISQLDFIADTWHDGIDDGFFIIYLLIIYVSAVRLVGALAAWYGREIVSQTETELDDKFLTFFRALANLIVSAIAFIILLGHFGIEPSALVTTLGIGTLAIALAAQETLSDIIAGFMILLDQPFAVGDRVELLDIDTWGDVIDIGLRSTRILTRDNRMVTVPNSVIGKGLVVNYSDPSTVYRVQTHVGLAYGTDVEEARQVMIEAIQAEPWVMKARPVEALLLELGDFALIFRVRCWIEDYVETRRVIDKMNTALYQALNLANIEIPFPQQDIRIYSSGVIPDKQEL